MPLPSLSFLLGIIVGLYLLTFVIFAVLRIVTGVSIGRVGISGLRRIVFTPRHGIKISIRGLGFSLHRRTFALPTICSLLVQELVVTVDLEALENGAERHDLNLHGKGADEGAQAKAEQRDEQGHGKLWRKLTEAKEKIKRLHRQIMWIRLFDFIATTVTLEIVGVGVIGLERMTVSVDTRRQTTDRSRLFQHHKHQPDTQAPAEWKVLIRSILFTPEGKESTEILDYCTLNIHGMLHREREGLRDASIALKFGRLNVPYDDLEHAKRCADLIRGKFAHPRNFRPSHNDVPIAEIVNKLEQPHNSDQRIVRTVSDSRTFISSILRGIQEVQVSIGFVGLSRKLAVKADADRDVYFNFAMKELGLDVLRLDPKSPAHRMYFTPNDVAHQGLLTGIAISAGIDDGHEHPERMLYVPMITATVKTTLPSRTLHFDRESGSTDRNTNILYANFVCTSPSIDLDPKHLPLIQEVMKQRSNRPDQTSTSNRHDLISQLLPKAHLKISIQEPVVRISLPPMDKANSKDDDFDLLISAVSSVALECESSHADGHSDYTLSSYYRHSRHRLYYQTASGERHDLLRSDFVEVQVDVHALPEVSVTATGRAQTFTIFLIRPDICEGVRHIVKQLRKNMRARKNAARGPQASFLRTLPHWLQHLRLEGSDFALELGGVDEAVSKDTRGIALQLESWTTEYTAHRDEKTVTTTSRRRSFNRSQGANDSHARPRTPDSPRKRVPQSFADGRRLVVHLQNMDGLIVDYIKGHEPESFMAIPRFEVAFSTSTDGQGPIFHVNSHARTILLQYSLYNHFAIGVAVMVVRRTILDAGKQSDTPKPVRQVSHRVSGSDPALEAIAGREITSFDFKSNLVQVKAQLPADPPMMLQIYNIETGRHRWSTPFFRTRLARLYVRAPRTKSAWSRIVSIKVLRLDLREIRRKVDRQHVAEKSVDISSEVIRFSIPHSLVVHTIFDNITNIVKTTKQLQHHLFTGTNDYILRKEPEGPKHVPRIVFRTQVFIFDVEDSNFEWKLGAIYRAGLLEQKQRLAREEAFRLKAKRLARAAPRGSSRRAQSAQPTGDRSRQKHHHADPISNRSHSAHPVEDTSPHHSPRQSRRKMRYDAEAKCGLSDDSHLTIEQARAKLNNLNSQSWKSRIDRVMGFQSHAIREIRTVLWGHDDLPENSEQHEPILAMSQRPGLMIIAFTELNIVVDKPSFPVNDFPKFLHDVGKGMPMDMKYGLVVPMNLQVTMGEARVQLRDYPLPLLHVPPLSSGQSQRLPALSMRTDFVVAEEFRDVESQRDVDVEIVPAEKMSSGKSYSIDVKRTISSIKTYSDMKFEIHTSSPTKITWSTSYQPAIQDAMQVVEGFTKPPVDPSDKVGFWDKVRLAFHSRVNIAWKGEGDLHFILKGSRDPYVVTGQGAGLVMVWRNDVNWKIGQDPDPRKFMQVDSGDYILAVPNFNSYARRSQGSDDHDDSGSSATSSSLRRDAVFRKVVMKLSGKVTWLVGLMFERDLADGGRTFNSKNHYDIVLKHPKYAFAPPGEVYDAYRGFRSEHIHMSIAIAAPHDRNWSVSNLKPSNNYNSVHLTPRFFSHFFSWWSMFSGIMSLPIRQGPLWGVTEKKSKKFGRHLATIKYNLLLSPLFISHVYKHKDAEDYASRTVSATGLKMRLDSFMLDLHQRREHFDLKGREGARTKKTSGIRINQAQLDFISADLRALSASIEGTSTEDMDKANDETIASFHAEIPSVDISKFEIPDNDFSWIDMDDFVELDWILPAESDPETKILPLGYAPRFTYFRQTDHNGTIAGDVTRTSPFGDEPTHYCVMSKKNDPRRVQAELIEKRLEILKEKTTQNVRAVGEYELKLVQSSSDDKATYNTMKAKLATMREQVTHLQGKHDFLQDILSKVLQQIGADDSSAIPDLETNEAFYEAHENVRKLEFEKAQLDSTPLADYTSDFNNRFIVHNAQIKWNNALRNIILRYIHQNSQRRGFVYYMSRKAVKFILDVLEERQKKANDGMSTPTRQKSHSTQHTAMSPEADDDLTVQDRIDQLLRDGRSFINADEASEVPEDRQFSKNFSEAPSDDIAVEFTPLNTYHFRLIAPQVQLQSEKNPKAVALVTAKGMQLKVVQIMEKDKIDDDVSGLVQRRFTAAADSLQMFVASTKTFSTEYLHFYSANRYGTKADTYWPPWVPMEIMFDFNASPYGFDRIVHRTSASLRYDKYNNLRLKYNDDISGGDPKTTESAQEAENRMDHVWLDFPYLRAICDSTQYFAMYIIVMDLLLYNEPLEKTRSERLEKIMLASDFSDLTGAPEMVQMLQERIRQLEEIKMQFQVNEKYLDRQGWKDRIAMDQDLAGCEDELFFMMKAITTSQQRIEDRRDQENATGLMHLQIASKEIAWHLIREKAESLMEVQLKDASFNRTDNNDGSNHNSMEIGRINGYNLLNDALYPEIIAPFEDDARGGRLLGGSKMLSIHWLMLEAIAGIPVVDYFEIDLVPLKLQVEREVAKKLFEYIFPGAGGNAFDDGGFSPFMVKNMVSEETEDEPHFRKGSDGPTGSEMPEPNGGINHGNGPGSLDARLKPTLSLQQSKKPRVEHRGLGIAHPNSSHHGFSIFHHSDKPRSGSRSAASRQALGQTNLTPMNRSPSERSLLTLGSGDNSGNTSEKNDGQKRHSLHRTQSDEKKRKDKSKDKDKEKDARSDDLTQMMNRASNYMTLAFVKIPSLVLCLSYKGQGKRNIEDVHDLVFRLPTLEYRNKTWSNLDLALQLKKDVIRALISHAGAIVGNKFHSHKVNRQQQSRLREIANRSTFISTFRNGTGLAPSPLDWHDSNASETSSNYESLRPQSAGPTSSRLSQSVSLHSSPHSLSTTDDKDHAVKTIEESGSNGFHDASPPPTSHSARPAVRLSKKSASPNGGSSEAARPRTASITRRITGFSDRLRSATGTNNNHASASVDGGSVHEDTEDWRRKSKLRIGGQKLLGRLRD